MTDPWRWRDPFFVQRSPREMWHVESPDDPERMLCGEVIAIKENVDSDEVKIQKRWGLKPCPWCEKQLDEATGGRFSR